MTREPWESDIRLASGSRFWPGAPLLILCAGALLMSGCAFRRQAAGMAIEHNDFVAQTTNRQTVLNILRAREREPMHFTSFANVSGKVQGQGQIGLNTALNGDGGQLALTDTTQTTTGSTGALSQSVLTDTAVDTAIRGATNFTPSAQISVTTGTDFTLAVNATEEFYRGILGPLSPGIIVHYLRQGFPPDLLSHLVIRQLQFRLKVVDGAEKTIRTIDLPPFVNSPDDADKAGDFAEMLKCWRLDTVMKATDAVRVAAPAIGDLSGVSADVLARIKRVKDPDGIHRFYLEVSPGRNEPVLALVETGWPECKRRDVFEATVKGLTPGLPAAAGAGPAPRGGGTGTDIITNEGGESVTFVAKTGDPVSSPGAQQISDGVGPTDVLTLSRESERLNRLLPDTYKAVVEIDITFRSAEGILYYLGEYVRNEARSPKLRRDEDDKEACVRPEEMFCIPIVRVLPASQIRSSDRLIDVLYRGRRYAVPIAGARLTERSGRSSQTISLVQQLLNLHRSSKDLPFTPLVRVQN
jgi:hypothetical protein